MVQPPERQCDEHLDRQAGRCQGGRTIRCRVASLCESVRRLPVLQTNRTGAAFLPSLGHLAVRCVGSEYLREARAIANTGGADLLRKTRTLVGGYEALR